MAISFVQVAHAGSTSLSFSSNTTAGNCVVVGYADVDGPTTVTAVKLGGSAGNFAKAAELNFSGAGDTDLISLWYDPSCAGGQTAIAITATGTNFPMLWAAEFSGIVTSSALDKTSTHGGNGGSWTSNTTATTTQAIELWVGGVANSTSAPSGPAAPWVNTAVSNSSTTDALFGYKIVSAAGGAVYADSGTTGNASGWSAGVMTLKGVISGSLENLLLGVFP